MLFSRDTSPEARRVLIEILRTKTPAEKLEMVDDAFRMVRDLTMSGLRMRNPDATATELEVLYLEHILGREVAHGVLAARSRAEPPPAAHGNARSG